MPKKKNNKGKLPAYRHQSIINGQASSKTATNSQNIEEDFIVSFKYLDRNQGQSFKQWEETKQLARAMYKLRNYCCSPLKTHIGNGLEIYGTFPEKSDFQKPNHVPEDAQWARIHVTGEQVIAGYVNRNIFNVVFLDENHGFYKTEKRNT